MNWREHFERFSSESMKNVASVGWSRWDPTKNAQLSSCSAKESYIVQSRFTETSQNVLTWNRKNAENFSTKALVVK